MAETVATEQTVTRTTGADPARPSSQPPAPAASSGQRTSVREAPGTESASAADDLSREAGDASSEPVGAEGDRGSRVSEDLLVQEGDVAGDYLERLLDLVDYDGDIDLDVEGDRAVVSIDGGEDLEKLVGSRGAVLEALQELTRLAVQQQTGTRSRLMLDIAQWRSVRRAELTELGRSVAQRVAQSGEAGRLQPMTPFERKIVHDAVAAVAGVVSESEGEEPRRRVVIYPSPS